MSSISSPAPMPVIVGVDAWAEFPWLHAGFSTRLGGVSSVYGEAELNLGFTDADGEANVVQNRQSLFTALSGRADFRLITVRQFHSNLIRHVDSWHGPLMRTDGRAALRGDALVTAAPGFLLGALTADCVPVLIADTKRRVVAALHAGWRGTLGRIVERSVGDFVMRYDSDPRDLVAAIGPCIGGCCFEVGEEVRGEFRSQFAYGERLFREDGKQLRMDLVEANRQQLLAAGLAAERVTAVGECTACTRVDGGRRKYFSHRAERGFTGRMLSVIGAA